MIKRATDALKKALFIAAALLVLPTAAALASTHPYPNYGTASVDGNGSEWSGDDFFDYLYWTSGGTTIKAKVYLRYDCDTQVLYLRVKGYNPTYTPRIDSDSGSTPNHKVWIDNVLRVQGGSTNNDGTPPDFSYYGNSNGTADGWEASISLVPGTYQLMVQTEVFITPSGPEDIGAKTGNGSGSLGNIQLIIDGCSNVEYDFGDLPNNYSIVTISENGAQHQIGDLFLGATIDAETNGQHDPNALGDDNNGSDDEDGVVPTAGVVWVTGTDGGSLDVFVTGGEGCLDGWIDWNGTGVFFAGAGEYVIQNVHVYPGLTTFTFDIPAGTSLSGQFFARFRLYPLNGDGNCSGVGGQPTGVATNGEVEDYVFDPSHTTAVTVTSLTARASAGALPVALAAGGFLLLIGLAVVFKRQV